MWEQINVLSASTVRELEDSFGTFGSNTISSLFTPLREAAATFREMLKSKAAAHWSLEPEALVAMNGTIFKRNDPTEVMRYGQIAALGGDWEVPKDPPPLKLQSDYRYIGQAMPRLDFSSKLTGKAIYGYDARTKDMLYGAVARPPTLTAKLKSARPGRASEVAGVVKVVIEDDFAGVVATSRAAAYKALELLAIEWQPGESIQQSDIDALITVKPNEGTLIQREGRVRANLKGQLVEAEYRTPLAAHAQLEPQAALVDVRADKVTAQVSTQAPLTVRNELAKLLGRKKEDVEVTATYLGGGFGRKANVEVALEAARLSRAVGKAVHVGWRRNEEFRHGYLRPPTHSVLKAALANGRIHAIEHQQRSGDVLFSFFPDFLKGIMGADFAAWRGATIPYDIPHRRVLAQRTELPVKTGPWRGLGLFANIFALESFIDELAFAANSDPLDFRLAHLSNDDLGRRFKTVLRTAAERAAWDNPLEGRARGLACCIDVNTIVAQVAEVSVEDDAIRVHKITCAVDPGLIINPDGVKAQTQGNIIMGLSATLLEQLTIKDSQIEASNFDRYPLLTMKDTPEIEVVLLESGNQPYGMGEPPIGPVAAAVANAVFALTGQRLRKLPLRLS
jgi:isoquinoline 1-oxidoreductase beta subunit